MIVEVNLINKRSRSGDLMRTTTARSFTQLGTTTVRLQRSKSSMATGSSWARGRWIQELTLTCRAPSARYSKWNDLVTGSI